MLMVALVVLAVAAVPLLGGDLRRLGDLRLRGTWLLPVSLLLQILMMNVLPGLPHAADVALHLVSYLLAAAFLWLNRSVDGLLLVGLGAGLNAFCIFLNGGTLPASERALRTAGLPVDTSSFTNSGVLPHPRLAFLGDVFAVPSWVPLANVYSVGDVLVVLGAVYLLLCTCLPERTAPATA